MIYGAFLSASCVLLFFLLVAAGNVQPWLMTGGLAALIISGFCAPGPAIARTTWWAAARRLGWSEATTSRSWAAFNIEVGLVLIAIVVALVAT